MLIGIDWGGTKIEGVAMQPNGQELLRLREATPRHDYRGCLKAIKAMVDSLESQTGLKGSIGIGIPGSLEPLSRLGKGASSTWLLGQPVEADLQVVLQRDIRVENDADCFAASEAVDGAGQGYNVVFAVILGSGAGAGIAINGKAHHGPNNSGGEWGHNPLPFPSVTELPGKSCYCGRHGCMETWVSGRAFEAQYLEHKGLELKANGIIELKRRGDHLANLLWQRYIDRVARGLATVVNALDPDIFVMGGGMSNVDELYEDLPRELAKRTFSTVFHTPIKRNKHGDASGVRGAAWLLEGMMMEFESRYQFGLALVVEAGGLALSCFNNREKLIIQSKGIQDMASEADLNTELLIKQKLAAAFPQDAFLGEETGRTDYEPNQGIWVVDPIDGTQPFISGLSSWCVSIAFVQNGRLQFGMVCAPARNELFAGGAGHRATLNGTAIAGSKATHVNQGLTFSGYSPKAGPDVFLPAFELFLKAGGMFYRDGSGALGLCYVAAGRLIGYFEPLIKSWDCLGAVAVIEAAGLETNDFLAGDGLFGGNPIIAGNAAVYAQLAAIVVQGGTYSVA